MKKKNKKFVYLTADGQKAQYYKTSGYELIRLMILLLTMLLSLQDLMYSKTCLIFAVIVGFMVLIIRQMSLTSMLWTKRIDFLLYLAGLVCLAISNLSLIQAIFDLMNRCIILCNVRFDLSLDRFAADARAAFGSIILWGLIAGIMASFIFRQAKQRKLYGTLLFLVVTVIFGLILGTSSMVLPVFLALISISNIFVYDCIPNRELNGRFFICRCLSLFLMICLLFISSFYKPSQNLQDWKDDASHKIEEVRYGKDSLPKGEFSKADKLLNGKEKCLTIEIDQPQELYLKGFVGGSYMGDQWTMLSNDHFEGDYEGILNWLAQKDFDPLMQYASYEKINAKQSKHQFTTTKINITNEGAYRKYLYLPMTLSSLDAFRVSSDRDWNIDSKRLFGTSAYKFQTVHYTQDLIDATAASWLSNTSNTSQKNYQQAESVYNKFVNDSYKDIDSSLKKIIKTTFFKDTQKMDFKETTTRIRLILRQKITYSQRPQNYQGQKDYVTWLLEDAKEGNAVSYATTAVMAYRSAGYPARYVEGYHLSKADADQLSKDHKHKASLTTQNAHAWVEVYRSGIGWIPVEVVPGMYTETYSTQTVQGKPSYQLKSKKDKSGINTEHGKSGKAKTKEKKKKTASNFTVKYVTTTLLIMLYLILILYLILELQRMIRLYFWNKSLDNLIPANDCADILEQFWKLSKIKGDYSRPFSLEPAILAVYPQVDALEYRRAVELIQKSRFGGKTLKIYEQHTLTCFVHKISHLLWLKQSIFGKIALRYIYIIPKR